MSSNLTRIILLTLGAAIAALGQPASYPFVVKTIAGAFPFGDGGPATSGLLSNPYSAVTDAAGNVFILDGGPSSHIRKVTTDGNISTFASTPGCYYDLKFGKDGYLYVACNLTVIKLSPSGTQTLVAGTGTFGFSGDGGPATNAQLSITRGLAFDTVGNLYIVDYNRVRKVTLDGKIQTIAGNGTAGFSGDSKAATSAQLRNPQGIAIDKLNNVYIADQSNRRVRKVAPDGTITTFAGNGNLGQPVNTVATASPFYQPYGLAVDDSNNVYVSDWPAGVVMKITPSGQMTRFAGTANRYGFYGDTLALNASLNSAVNVSVDASGNVLIVDGGTGRVRKITSDGEIHTIAGKIHFGGDGGPAMSALLSFPLAAIPDSHGDLLIADSSNFRLRKVTPDGVINTAAGTGSPGAPVIGAAVANSTINYIYNMILDAGGALYYADSGSQLLKMTPAGTFALVAGTGVFGDTGTGGPATSAQFGVIAAVTLDAQGNIYIADSNFNRVRKVSAGNGTISLVAGNGTSGFSGDGGPAPSAQLYLNSGNVVSMVVDKSGNLYIFDTGNNRVRMVSAAGVITTVAGNGTTGRAVDGQPATSVNLGYVNGLAVDSTGALYLTESSYGEIYRISNGILQRIVGSANSTQIDTDDPTLAANVNFFGRGLYADPNNDIYVADGLAGKIRKLVVNSPATMAALDGDGQSGLTGTALPKSLSVLVNGRGGLGVAGITVNFAVTSGSATVNPTSAQTDASGMASTNVTLGDVGAVTITATASGLPSVAFKATTGGAGSCTASKPTLTSAQSIGGFGGMAAFSSGSWLELHGSNLSTTTRPWGGSDFNGSNAPTNLDGVGATVNGRSGFVYYISPGQLNVLAPADPANGAVQITVTNCAGTSNALTLQKATIVPGMLAPDSFNIGGKQYLVALFTDGVYVGNSNLIAGAPFRPAKPGDTITTYGIGFGDVTPAIAPGVIVGQANGLNTGVTISFGQTLATLSYSGLAPGNIGLYQFNLTVPDLPDGDYQIKVTAGGATIPQTLFLTVHR